MQKYGRKFAHYFLCLPTFLGWLAIFAGNSVQLLLLGRFLTGKPAKTNEKGNALIYPHNILFDAILKD